MYYKFIATLSSRMSVSATDVALTTMKASVESSIIELNRFRNPDADLLKDYTTIGKDIDSLNSTKGTLSAEDLNTKVSDLNIRLVTLDGKKKTLLSTKEGKLTLAAGTYRELFKWLRIFNTIIGMILGAIIGSHWFLNETTMNASNNETEPNSFLGNFVMYKLFYALYGALLFPITLAYSCIFPPTWRAPLLPLYQRGDANTPSAMPFLFTYMPPSSEDTDTGKRTLQLMSVISMAVLFVTFYMRDHSSFIFPVIATKESLVAAAK
jgi:hypothetical protein